MHSNFFRAYGFWHVGEGFQTILMMWYMAFHAGLSATEIGTTSAVIGFKVVLVFGVSFLLVVTHEVKPVTKLVAAARPPKRRKSFLLMFIMQMLVDDVLKLNLTHCLIGLVYLQT